jgi:hypothetical protein
MEECKNERCDNVGHQRQVGIEDNEWVDGTRRGEIGYG